MGFFKRTPDVPPDQSLAALIMDHTDSRKSATLELLPKNQAGIVPELQDGETVQGIAYGDSYGQLLVVTDRRVLTFEKSKAIRRMRIDAIAENQVVPYADRGVLSYTVIVKTATGVATEGQGAYAGVMDHLMVIDCSDERDARAISQTIARQVGG